MPMGVECEEGRMIGCCGGCRTRERFAKGRTEFEWRWREKMEM